MYNPAHTAHSGEPQCQVLHKCPAIALGDARHNRPLNVARSRAAPIAAQAGGLEPARPKPSRVLPVRLYVCYVDTIMVVKTACLIYYYWYYTNVAHLSTFRPTGARATTHTRARPLHPPSHRCVYCACQMRQSSRRPPPLTLPDGRCYWPALSRGVCVRACVWCR